MKLYTEDQINELMVLLQKSFLPENVECDGGYCMGCWKDVVRETLKKMVNLTPIELPDYEKVTRFEVIDHTSSKEGRTLVRYSVMVDVSIQDDGMTMKVFLTDKYQS